MKKSINWKKEASLIPGYAAVTVYVLFTAIVLIWILGASLSTAREIFSGTVFKFESGIHWDNYVRAWNVGNVSLYFKNSLIYAGIGCIGAALISAPAAYILSRYSFRGSKAITAGLVIAMSIPPILIILPLYSLAVKLDIRGMVLMTFLFIFMRVPFTTTYLIDFFSSLSKTYEEAAALDGCSTNKIFWKIMLPLVQPALVSVTIFNFLGIWNEYFISLIFANDSKSTPVGVGLQLIVSAMKYTGDYGGLFAAVVIVFVPTFLIYIFMSERIIQGVTGGGIKG